MTRNPTPFRGGMSLNQQLLLRKQSVEAVRLPVSRISLSSVKESVMDYLLFTQIVWVIAQIK